MIETKEVHFDMSGENMLSIINLFKNEGKYNSIYSFLTEGNPLVTNEMIKGIVFGGYTVIGDNINELQIVEDNTSLTVIENNINSIRNDIKYMDIENYTALVNIIGKRFNNVFQYKLDKYKLDIKCKNLYDELYRETQQYYSKFLSVNYYKDVQFSYDTTALILPDGIVLFIYSKSHSTYEKIWKELYNENLEDIAVYVTEGNYLYNKVVNHLSNLDVLYDIKDINITEEQIDAILSYNFRIKYNYGCSINELIRRYYICKYNNGSKYGNLMFLKKLGFPIVYIDTKPFECKSLAIRTSLKNSLPGVMTSRFNVTDIPTTIKEIKEEYNTKIKGNNELYLFYQEFIEGDNGVCTYIDNKLNARIGNQGDLVNNVEGKELNEGHLKELDYICYKINKYLDIPFQLEFVIHNNQIFIVQLRTFNNIATDNYLTGEDIYKALCTGKSFTKGRGTCNINDILIVESEYNTSDLPDNIKLIIVKNDVDFAHTLALSDRLNIPSMYGVKNIDKIKTLQTISFNTGNRTAIIMSDN